MNTSGTEYGSMAKIPHGFQSHVTNPITKERINLGVHKTSDEAQEAINKWNFDFFSDYSWILPRNISLDRRAKTFVFCVQIREKTIRVAASKRLDDVMEQKLTFINKMI